MPRTEPETRPAESVLERLERLLEGATRGPWESRPELHPDREHLGAVFVVGDDGSHIADPRTVADAVLIAEARNALPALVAAVRAAEDVLAELDIIREIRERNAPPRYGLVVHIDTHNALRTALQALQAAPERGVSG